MMNVKHSVAVSAVIAAFALAVPGAMGALPFVAMLTIATTMCAGFMAVAFAAQSRGFEGGGNPVYRPVYVRSRNVHRRVSPHDD